MDKHGVKRWVLANTVGDEKYKARLWEGVEGAFRYARAHKEPTKTLKLPLAPSGQLEKVRFTFNQMTRGHNGHPGPRTGIGIEILPPEPE